MTWPLFAVIQLVMITIGVSVAFVLRHRTLRGQYDELAEALDSAGEAVALAQTRMTDGAERVWLQDRIATLDGEDEISQLQRLVLENELDASADFGTRLNEKLSAGEAAEASLRARWEQARRAAFDLSKQLIEKYPHSHPVIVQLHDAYAELDSSLEVDAGALPDAPEVAEGDKTDLTQEAEHLRATNELLQQELDKSKAELATQLASGEDAEEQAEDLKGLLQQFTRDSRDMMTCIQQLEAENAELKSQLSLGTDSAPQLAPKAETAA